MVRYFSKYRAAISIHSLFSMIPRRVLHTAQSNPLRQLSQAWQAFVQQLWSWSTWKVGQDAFGSSEPQIAHLFPCSRRVCSYQARVTPYWRNLLTTCNLLTSSGLATLQAFVAAFNSSLRRAYQFLWASLARCFAACAFTFSGNCCLNFLDVIRPILLAQDLQCAVRPLFTCLVTGKADNNWGIPTNSQSFREHTLYNDSDGDVTFAPISDWGMRRGYSPDISILLEREALWEIF